MSCEYQCVPKTPKKIEENNSSYTQHNLESNIYYIIGRIKELFRERHVYTLNQISAAINVVRVYPIAQIYYVLSKFIDNRNMVLFDKYGRFGYLLNRGKYYEFQPVEITDTRSSVRDRSVPVEYKRGNIILELNDKITKPREQPLDVNAVKMKSVVSRDHPSDLSYSDIIHEIRTVLDTLRRRHDIKSTEMDWYKNASRAIEHLHIVHAFDEITIIKYVIYHYLDSANYNTKRILFEYVIDEHVFEEDPEIETHIASYFRDRLMLSNVGDKEGIYIANREDSQLIVRDIGNDAEDTNWKEGDRFDATDFSTDYSEKYEVDKKVLNDIVGYMIQFKDQDMSFYYKNIHLKRNTKGRRCDRSGGKAPIIDMLNLIVGSKMYTEENTSSLMYSGSLCVILEMLLRKYNDEKKSGKMYYLSPEQAIQNKITDYSTKT